MSTAATPITSQPTGNKFDFASRSGKVKVTYYPIAPGPPIVGRPPGPSFSYSGPEGQLGFSGAEIAQEATQIGILLSVVLKPQDDTGSTVFSLFLPPVAMANNSKSQAFATYAVKTQNAGSSGVVAGAQLSYDVESLAGNAEMVILPL